MYSHYRLRRNLGYHICHQSKKVTSQSIIGQQGANLIEQIVLKMGYVWRATSIFDVGIDGEIEIRDPMTGEMTNTIVKVQAKATTNAIS